MHQYVCVHRITTIIPITEVSTYLILKYRERFADIHLPFVNFEKFDALTNKFSLFQTAQKLNITIPTTYFVREYSDLKKIYPKLTFPVVLKPYRSRIPSNGKWIQTSVHYGSSIPEIEETVAKYVYLNQHPFLLQEYIHGQGQGLFALYNQSQPVIFFAHRRLREKPPWGGVSVLSESMPLDPDLCAMGRRILDDAQWHGVAMVEFKVSHDGKPYLMEVNARFWGSLQLAVDAGVDFPWLLYQLAEGKPMDPITDYVVGMKNRWLLGDCSALYTLLIRHNTEPYVSYKHKWRSLLHFLNFFQRNTRYEINRWHDLAPFFFELKHYARRKAKWSHSPT